MVRDDVVLAPAGGWWLDQLINADLESEEDASFVVSEDASEVGSQASTEDSAKGMTVHKRVG